MDQTTFAVPFEVESGIEIPPTGAKPGPVRITMLSLQVGQSFLVPGETNLKTVRVRCRQIYIETKRKFVTRQVPGGIRVWRVK